MKKHLNAWAGPSAFSPSDIANMQDVFDIACIEMALIPSNTEPRARVARAIFFAYRDGNREASALFAAAWSSLGKAKLRTS